MNEQILEELVAIRRLLIAAMMKSGSKQDEIAKALGVDQSQISRMFAEKKENPKKSKQRRR